MDMDMDMAIVVTALLTTKDLPQKGIRVCLQHVPHQGLGAKVFRMRDSY